MERSESITEMIRQALESADYRYGYDEEENFFTLGIDIPGQISKLRCVLRETNYGFWVFASAPIGGDVRNRDMMRELAELIVRINLNLSVIKFSMDMEDGELRSEIDYPCKEGFKPSPNLILGILALATEGWRRFGSCFLGVIFGGKSAKDAFESVQE